MYRMHVMVKVADVAESTSFYHELFGVEPTVVKPDYAKWMLDDPRLNFSIGQAGRAETAGIEHLGIEAENETELAALRARIKRLEQAGAAVDDEGETTCCYAESDKTWIVDGQGVSWEAFYTHRQAATDHGSTETYRRSPGTEESAVCCATECCDGERADSSRLAAVR